MSEIPNKKDIIPYFHIMETVNIISPLNGDRIGEYEHTIECECSDAHECLAFCNAVRSNMYCARCEGAHHFTRCPLILAINEPKRRVVSMCITMIAQAMMLRAIESHYCEEVTLDDFPSFLEGLEELKIDRWGCHEEHLFEYKSYKFSIDMPPRRDDFDVYRPQTSLVDAVRTERAFVLYALDFAHLNY